MRTRSARCCLASVALALAGCGDGESETAPPTAPGSCDTPNRLVDGACREPGVQDGGCLAGELALESGECLQAGLAAELCAEGFTFDEVARTCEPVLPPDVCAGGTMALPGEIACRPVASCGSGSWGDILVEANTIYVDGSYSGGASDGSQGDPYVTVSDGLDSAPVGAIVAVAAGTYVEDVTIRRAVRLWGVCPDQVDVVATGADASGLVVTAAAGAEIRGIGLRHPNNGAALVVFDVGRRRGGAGAGAWLGRGDRAPRRERPGVHHHP